MNSEERVLRTLDFEKPDRVPLYDSYWPEFVETWRREKGIALDTDVADEFAVESGDIDLYVADEDITDYYQMDVAIIIPDETPFPSQKATLEVSEKYEVFRTGWGMVRRREINAKFYEALEVALPERDMLDKLVFESPLLERRYYPSDLVERLKSKYCVFVKTGGPYLRTSNLRGTTQWLMDLVEDEGFARELAMRVTRQMTAVGLEAMRRHNLYHTGIWFFDDMGSNRASMFSPRTFERVLYPCYKWMCDQYREVGVEHILLHCDGNIASILDMLVDAGIQGFHPVEPKAGMDVVDLRARYGRRLALIGGLDNAHILTRAPLPDLRDHVLHVLESGVDGGLVIGAHSIGPDVSVARYDYVRQLIQEFGGYA